MVYGEALWSAKKKGEKEYTWAMLKGIRIANSHWIANRWAKEEKGSRNMHSVQVGHVGAGLTKGAAQGLLDDFLEGGKQ